MRTADEMIKLGSDTAKNGFRNEQEIADKFNNWQSDQEAILWLQIMKYNLDEIEWVTAEVINGYKADINVQIMIKLKKVVDIENIQVKLVSNKKGFNQIDKRWLENYSDMWNIPPSTLMLLKHFTGELTPKILNSRDKRRMFIDEFNEGDRNELIRFFENNKVMITNDILRGRGRFAAEWMLVAQKSQSNARWVLKPMNAVVGYYFGDGKITISPRGSLILGKITIQRKGGDGGRETANMLQFKINPADLFDI